MYIVRWLMGHPIVATWVLGAVAILLTVGSGKKESMLDQSNSSRDNIEVSAATKLVDKKEVVVEKSAHLKDESKPVNENNSSVSDMSNTSKNITDTKISNSKETGAVLKPAIINLDQKETTSAVEVMNIPTESGDLESEDLAITDLGQVTSEEMLLMAREAYWNNGLDEASQIYKKLISIEPKVLEHRGELGNVYWRQGYPKKAAELYSEIALPMIEEGGSERVANMIGFIGLFYPDRAAEIHKRMQSKISSDNVQK